MSEYISREAFLAEQRHLYCENCARRKNGKGKFVYGIGDAPCRACDIGDVLDAVEDFPAADVRPVVKARWGEYEDELFGETIKAYCCSNCHHLISRTTIVRNYCPRCGAKMEES